MLERVLRKGSPLTLLMGTHTGAATTENSVEGPQKKLKTGLRFDPGVPPRTARGEQDSTQKSHPGQPEESRTRPDARPGTHTSTVHGNQDGGAAECPSAEERHRGHGAHTTDGQPRRGGNRAVYSNTDGPRGDHTEPS